MTRRAPGTRHPRWPLPCAAVALTVACACSAPATNPRGETLDVFAPFRNDAADRFVASLAPFEETTGIDVRYVGSADYANELRRRVNDANPPDVALVPQPGVVAELVALGAVTELSDDTADAITTSLLPEALPLGEVDDRLVGVPYRLSVKSLVWYRPDQFDEHGWALPESLDELATLTSRIRDQGSSPWCFGIEAFGGTGWVVTDWIEDLVLRFAGPDGYDAWVAGDAAFADTPVQAAFEYMNDVLLPQGNVLGNQLGIAQTSVDEAILPMLADPPACSLHRNASFTQDWLPSGTSIGPEGAVDVFVLPGTDPDASPPVLVGVDLAVAMSDQPAAQQFLRYLATPEAGAAWAAAGGYLGPFEVEPGYYSPTDAQLASIISDAEVLRVDGSDQMHPDFGSGSFWSIAADWVSGLLDVGATIELLDNERGRTGA